MQVRVTEEHIKKSTKCAHNCPIAVSIRNLYNNNYDVFVVVTEDCILVDVKHIESIHTKKTGTKKYINVPIEAKKFIREFDLGYRVDPFEFNIYD